MKKQTRENRQSIKLPPFRVRASALVDLVESLTHENERVELKLAEDDGRTEITLEGIEEIRDHSYRIESPFTILIGTMALGSGGSTGSGMSYDESDEKRAKRILSFINEVTPWHVSVPFYFFQRNFALKVILIWTISVIPLYFFDSFSLTVALSLASVALFIYSFYLEFNVRPKIIHHQGKFWLERNKDQLAVYTIVAIIGAGISNIDRIWEFLQALSIN